MTEIFFQIWHGYADRLVGIYLDEQCDSEKFRKEIKLVGVMVNSYDAPIAD